MKVAIVGTSAKDLSVEQHSAISIRISQILARYTYDTIIISGGAAGVDSVAIYLAKQFGFETLVYYPKIHKWEGGYMERNLEIANACDVLYCISVSTSEPDCYHHPEKMRHLKTAGCWTLAEADKLEKQCYLEVIDVK